MISSNSSITALDIDMLVDKCTSREMMPTKLIRKFSKRARRYMVGYATMESHSNSQNQDDTNQGISHQKIERIKTALKNHRAALDFDNEFVMKTVAAADFNWEKEIETAKISVKRKRN